MKPASNINTWGGWPAHVVSILRSWNHASVQRLRFERCKTFICNGCHVECAGHVYGAAALDTYLYCDDCLIGCAERERLVLTA